MMHNLADMVEQWLRLEGTLDVPEALQAFELLQEQLAKYRATAQVLTDNAAAPVTAGLLWGMIDNGLGVLRAQLLLHHIDNLFQHHRAQAELRKIRELLEAREPS